jgi:hypothetical protein
MDIFSTMTITVGTTSGFCANTANIWQIVGYALLVFKIVIPILLIIFGMLDLGKAVVASKSDEVKKAATSLGFRAIGAVAIFLVPTIVGLVMGLIGGFSSAEADYNICKKCITNPVKGCEAADKLWNND